MIDFRDWVVVPGSVGEGRRWVKIEKGEVFRKEERLTGFAEPLLGD